MAPSAKSIPFGEQLFQLFTSGQPWRQRKAGGDFITKGFLAASMVYFAGRAEITTSDCLSRWPWRARSTPASSALDAMVAEKGRPVPSCRMRRFC